MGAGIYHAPLLTSFPLDQDTGVGEGHILQMGSEYMRYSRGDVVEFKAETEETHKGQVQFVEGCF